MSNTPGASRKTATFSVLVDYDLELRDAIALGRYDDCSENITEERFPNTRSGKADLEIELVKFEMPFETSIDIIGRSDALHGMRAQGLNPAGLRELLALGAAYPELQLELPIAALKSTWWYQEVGSEIVPILTGGGYVLDGPTYIFRPRGRSLGWQMLWGGFSRKTRFAGVRRS